jgi:hypothetical protein
MPVDFRYHLASLVAVFCALLIGILLGIALVGDPSLTNQVRAWRDQHAIDARTITTLRASQNNARAFGKQILPYLIDSRLKGTRVAIVLNRDLGDVPWVEAIITTIRGAGAQVTSVTTILPDFMNLQPKQAAGVVKDLGFLVPIEGDLKSILAGKLAARIAEGSPEIPFRLRQLGLIRVEGDTETGADVVLIIGGAETDLGSVNIIDLPMIRALQEIGTRVVACEASTDKLSCMHAYQRRAISTVDNADTASGQLAVILVLAGASGDFGIKNTADQLLPPLTQAER